MQDKPFSYSYQLFPLRKLRFSSGTDANAQKCTSVYMLRVFLMKNSILFRTTDILSAAAMFLLPQKLALNSVHGCTLLRESLKAGLCIQILLKIRVIYSS